MKRIFTSILLISLTLSVALLALADPSKRFRPNMTQAALDPTVVRSTEAADLVVSIDLPSGYHINKEAPSDAILRDGQTVLATARITQQDQKIPFALPKTPDKRELTFESTLYYCKEVGASVCLIKSFTYTLPISVSDTGSDKIVVALPVPPEAQG